MQGRVHFYEGYEMDEVMFLSRVLGRLGIKKLVVTNAAGGINTSYTPGDLMLISDHINLHGRESAARPEHRRARPPLPRHERRLLGSRCAASRKEVAATARAWTSRKASTSALSGPTYETPAEIRAFRILGADAVGMSTVPEVIAMSHMQIPVLGISCITNMAAGVIKQKLTHQEVMDTTARVQKQFTALVLALIARLKS